MTVLFFYYMYTVCVFFLSCTSENRIYALNKIFKIKIGTNLTFSLRIVMPLKLFLTRLKTTFNFHFTSEKYFLYT